MSADDDDGSEVPHPRETTALFGHDEAEQTLLESYRGGRIPHAWLIGGPRGIGKATLAYRMARFVLENSDQRVPAVQAAPSLAVAPTNPVARRVAAQAQNDLLVLERGLNEKGNLSQDIAVEDVRKTVSFFGSTSWDGGWRVAIIDSVEELNRSGENAILKMLEEPPPRSLWLLVSHAPGRLLPTIRSRCRLLLLRPLGEENVIRAAATALGRSPDDAELHEAAKAAEGSVAQALALLDGPALALRSRILGLLDALPSVDPSKLHGLGEALAGYDSSKLTIFTDAINGWLSGQLNGGAANSVRLARVAEVWDKVNNAARDVDAFNLERKPLVFAVFGLLAEAARG